MENLPSVILVDILSRLSDSTDLARCRLVSRTMRFLSGEVHSLSVFCSRARFSQYRADKTRELIIPFRSMVINLISFLSGSGALRSLSVSVEKDDHLWAVVCGSDDTDFDDADNLHLTDVNVLSQWLPLVALRLTSLIIGDYWSHACRTPSTALRLISENCCNLLNLEIKNAWLSVEGLKPMLSLINLKLEYIKLDDEDLNKVNGCFPCLQILNLKEVDCLGKPMINLSQLRICHWTVEFSLYLEIHAPKLVELKLECYEAKYLVLDTPLLTQIDLKINMLGRHIKVQSFICLKFVRMKISHLKSIKQFFGSCQTVRKLELDEFFRNYWNEESLGKITMVDIISTFPNVDDLKLGPVAWTQLCRDSRISSDWKNLKRLTIKLLSNNLDIPMLSYVLKFCIPSCEVAVNFHYNSPDFRNEKIIARCTYNFPRTIWKWGIWK